VLHGAEMLGCMAVFGGIAAAHMAAGKAQAQMHPGVAGFDAVLTNMRLGGAEFDLIQMRTCLCQLACPFERGAIPLGESSAGFICALQKLH